MFFQLWMKWFERREYTLVTCVLPIASSKCWLSMRNSINRKITFKQNSWTQSRKYFRSIKHGNHCINTWVYEDQGSRKLSDLPQVHSCVIVEPILLTLILQSFCYSMMFLLIIQYSFIRTINT